MFTSLRCMKIKLYCTLLTQLFRKMNYRIILKHAAILALSLCSTGTFAQIAINKIWSDVSIERSANTATLPSAFRAVSIQTDNLRLLLNSAPLEAIITAKASPVVISLPMPDGSMQRFSFVEAPIMEAELAARYPEIKTYLGQGIDNPAATVRFDLTSLGFHAMILSSEHTVFIDPITPESSLLISYYKENMQPSTELRNCATNTAELEESTSPQNKTTGTNSTGSTLRTYRLALAATAEYTKARGGTVAKALASMTTSVNRVVGVYEKEVAIRMVLISNTDQLIFTDATTDGYTNSNGSVMLSENQTKIDLVIGGANYDIGHVFSTGGGGIADLQSPCSSNRKARGVTGSSNPTGDPFDIDFVAHEMGHQFGGLHTFNSTFSGCAGNRSASAAYEPGSGVTIMGYAGLCGSDNILSNSIPYFHVKSFDQITEFSAGGGNCATSSATGNAAPLVDAGNDFVIPKSTPFLLTGTASDPNGDALTYSWEQYDLGPAGPPNQATETNAPLFRSFAPKPTPSRMFPQLKDVLSGKPTKGEILPSVGRDLNFRFIVRDNRAGGGGVAYDDLLVIVDNAGGPFIVTDPIQGTAWAFGQLRPVRWNVANSNKSPINCALVNILISYDSGLTFPDTLLKNAPNTGEAFVVTPNKLTTKGRILVQGVNNVFFNITPSDFAIVATGGTSAIETVLAESISIFPNPTKHIFTINLNGVDSKAVTVTNYLGQLIYETRTANTTTTIDLSTEKAGVYFVKVQTKDNYFITKKLIKL